MDTYFLIITTFSRDLLGAYLNVKSQRPALKQNLDTKKSQWHKGWIHTVQFKRWIHRAKNHSTQDSHVVPHHGTSWAAPWLTAQIRRDAVLSESYGRGCLTLLLKQGKSDLRPCLKIKKKIGQLNSLTTTTNAFSDIQRKVDQPPHIVPTLTSCSARHKNGGPTNVHLPTRVRQGHLGI